MREPLVVFTKKHLCQTESYVILLRACRYFLFVLQENLSGWNAEVRIMSGVFANERAEPVEKSTHCNTISLLSPKGCEYCL